MGDGVDRPYCRAVVVVDDSVSERVAALVCIDQDVGGGAVRSVRVADASEVHCSDPVDEAINGFVRVAADHDVSVTAGKQSLQICVTDEGIDSRTVVRARRGVDAEHACSVGERRPQRARQRLQPRQPARVRHDASRPPERVRDVLEPGQQGEVRLDVCALRIRTRSGDEVALGVATHVLDGVECIEPCEHSDGIGSDGDDVAEHPPSIDGPGGERVGDDRFQRNGVPVDVGYQRKPHTPILDPTGNDAPSLPSPSLVAAHWRRCTQPTMLDPMKAGKRSLDRLLKVALEYPEAWEDHPWDENVVKVRKKIFVFANIYDGKLGITVKLPDSRDFALSHEWAEPSGYGLGRAGWVSAAIPLREDVPIDLFEEWIDESYRAIAPKTLVKQLDA